MECEIPKLITPSEKTLAYQDIQKVIPGFACPIDSKTVRDYIYSESRSCPCVDSFLFQRSSLDLRAQSEIGL